MYTTNDIARRLGVSQKTIQRVVKDLGLETSGRGYIFSREDYIRVVNYYKSRDLYSNLKGKYPRQDEALVWLMKGLTYDEIAEKMVITSHGVATLFYYARKRFKVKTNEHLIVKVLQTGYISLQQLEDT